MGDVDISLIDLSSLNGIIYPVFIGLVKSVSSMFQHIPV